MTASADVRVLRYRAAADLRRHWQALVALALVLAIGGGLGLGALAGARRTASAFPTFLRSTQASDMSVGTALVDPSSGPSSGYDAPFVRAIRNLPHVRRARSFAGVNAYQLDKHGAPRTDVNDNIVGSVDGQYFDQDRLTVLQGRMADPRRADEMVMSPNAARIFGLRIGDWAPWAVYPASADSVESATPVVRLRLHLVGTVVFNDAVVQDQIDLSSAPESVVLTPALTRRVTSCCSNYAFTYLTLDHGVRDVHAVEAELARIFPPGLPLDVHQTSVAVAKAQRAVQPVALALAVFGGIALLATLFLAGQAAARRLRADAPEVAVLRALGAAPRSTVGDGLPGIMLAAAAGGVGAAAVAIGLSPLFPLGPVHSVAVAGGLAVDWVVVGGGCAMLVLGIGLVSLLASARRARRGGRASRETSRPPALADALARLGAPAPAVTGARFAFGGGADRMAVRASLAGAVLAVAVVVATVVFGISLNGLVGRPALFGWNWDEALTGGGGVGVVPEHLADQLLARDRAVEAWAGYSFATVQVDGLVVPALAGRPGAPVGPPVLSGHAPAGDGQVVLGPATLAALHARVGDRVTVAVGSGPGRRLQVVGTATLPTIGITGVDTDHLSMARGAWIGADLVPESVRNSFGNTPTGPNVVFVRLRPGGDRATGLRSLQGVAQALTLPTNYGVTVLPVQLPAEILNYRSMGATPALLGSALALGTVATLGMSLLASVRRRRRDLALLRTFGFSGRQLAACLSWQSTMTVLVGLLIGLPLGAATGRSLWNLFARGIGAVPAPIVEPWVLVVVAAGGLLLANVVAVMPGRLAANTSAAALLRAD